MTAVTLERAPAITPPDLLRSRPDFTLRLDRDGVRRLLDEAKTGRIACCETGAGWCVWRLEGARG